MTAPAVLLVLAVALASPAAAQGGATLVPQTGARSNEVRASLEKIKLPPGFAISLYALVPSARHMAVGPRGRVTFIGTNRTRVYAMMDRGGKGVADEVRQFAANVDMKLPNGVCFARDGSLFIVEQNRVTAYPSAEEFSGRDIASVPVVRLGELIPPSEESSGHSTRVCRVGPDERLYISLGQPYNVSPRAKVAAYERLGIGGIISMTRDGKDRKVFAKGIRNSVGMDFNPADGTLWFTDNQVDRMGDLIPPGELNRATRAGQNFGFPWYGGGRTRTNEYRSDTPPADVVFPEVEMDAHAADLGMTFYTGAMFPARYRGALFSAQHGSWDRTTPIGARVMVTFLNADGTAGATEVFAEGWLKPDGQYAGRPVDVAMLADGSLLVSDDFAGAVYRVTYADR